MPPAAAIAAHRAEARRGRGVGAEGHAAARSYVGGWLLLAGLKPILTDTFTVEAPAPACAPSEDGPALGAAGTETRRASRRGLEYNPSRHGGGGPTRWGRG